MVDKSKMKKQRLEEENRVFFKRNGQRSGVLLRIKIETHA